MKEKTTLVKTENEKEKKINAYAYSKSDYGSTEKELRQQRTLGKAGTEDSGSTTSSQSSPYVLWIGISCRG